MGAPSDAREVTSKRPPASVPPVLAWGLSIFLITIGLVPFEVPLRGKSLFEGTPTLVGHRDESQGGIPFVANRATDFPVHYVWLHIIPALIWVVALPLQLSDSFRKRNPAVHRFMGYSIATMGIVLGITGILFPIRKHLTDTNITYSHPDFFHLHKLVLGGQTVLVWPTFDLALCVLFPAHMYSLYRTVNAARSRKYLEHRTWAVFHFITASLPSFLRIGNYTVIAVGYAIEHFASAEQKKQLGVPQDGPEQWRVEMAAFAFATWWIAGGIAVGWVAWLLRYRNMVWDQPASNSKAAVGEKGSKDVAGAL